MKKGFTLIELLVVVAIIAVIGAGVVVTYNRLDERAKIAMELNDCCTLQRIIDQKNALALLHSRTAILPNGLDSLIDAEGHLYSLHGNGIAGLFREAAFTLEAAKAPERVTANLVAAGLDKVYIHLLESHNANDSTFSTSPHAGSVDTKQTAAKLSRSGLNARVDALAAAEAEGTWWDYDADGPFTVAGTSYSTLAAFRAALDEAREFQDAATLDTLAFIYPGGGDASSPWNIACRIISQLGLTADAVASPFENAETAISNKRQCWLVAFGIGRFTTLSDGNAIRLDAPASGKRFSDDATRYSRYLLLVRVPVTEYSASSNQESSPQVAAVLSPQALTAAELSSLYHDAERATDN